MTTKTPTRRPHPPAQRKKGQPQRRGTQRGSAIPYAWTALVAVGLLISVMLLITARDTSGEAALGVPAKDFELTSTTGDTVRLADYSGQRVLLYFSEGVGCGGCWYQVAELEKNPNVLNGRDITLLPIVMNGADETRAEMARYGVTTPFLTDVTGEVSRSYDVVGSKSAMHDTLPGHTFLLVDEQGTVRWQGEYPNMFVEPAELADELDRALSS